MRYFREIEFSLQHSACAYTCTYDMRFNYWKTTKNSLKIRTHFCQTPVTEWNKGLSRCLNLPLIRWILYAGLTSACISKNLENKIRYKIECVAMMIEKGFTLNSFINNKRIYWDLLSRCSIATCMHACNIQLQFIDAIWIFKNFQLLHYIWCCPVCFV